MILVEVKEKLARRAVDENVKSGMKIGLGTGSTAIYAIRYLGELLTAGTLRGILTVPTSSQTEFECHALGIPLCSLNDPVVNGELDVTIDGADEIDAQFRLTKGGGGALLIEKVVAHASRSVVIIAHESKVVEHLGITYPIPLEVHRVARVPVTRALERLGARVEVRMAVKKMGPVITDNGNIVLDILFDAPRDVKELETELNSIPGILENGLFTRFAPVVYIGYDDGTVKRVH